MHIQIHMYQGNLNTHDTPTLLSMCALVRMCTRVVCTHTSLFPRTEKTGLKIITTAKISNKFSQESPYISNMFPRESTKFQIGFHMGKRSPLHAKEWTVKPSKSRDPNMLSLISYVSGSLSLHHPLSLSLPHPPTSATDNTITRAPQN